MQKARRLRRKKPKPCKLTIHLRKAEVWIVEMFFLPVITSILCQCFVTWLAHWLKW
jgi:hypothetical protein